MTIRSASAAPFEDLGLQTLMTWFPGRLLMLSVTLRLSELAETILIRLLAWLFTCTIVFPLNRPLTRERVESSVWCPPLLTAELLLRGAGACVALVWVALDFVMGVGVGSLSSVL